MAGADKEFEGEARRSRHQRSASCRRSRSSTRPGRPRQRRGGRRHIKDALKRLDEVYAAYADPDADFDKIAAEQAKSRRSSRPPTATLDRQLEVAADALRLPPWTRTSRRSRAASAAACALPAAVVETRHAAARRATNHLDAESVRWLEHFLEQYPGTVIE